MAPWCSPTPEGASTPLCDAVHGFGGLRLPCPGVPVLCPLLPFFCSLLPWTPAMPMHSQPLPGCRVSCHGQLSVLAWGLEGSPSLRAGGQGWPQARWQNHIETATGGQGSPPHTPPHAQPRGQPREGSMWGPTYPLSLVGRGGESRGPRGARAGQGVLERRWASTVGGSEWPALWLVAQGPRWLRIKDSCGSHWLSPAQPAR